jgi:hypothetical protein
VPLLTPPSMYTIWDSSLQGGQEVIALITFSLLEYVGSLLS